MSKYRSTQHTERPAGWMPRPQPGEKNYELKLSIWKFKLVLWLNFIAKD